jgi:predicted adenine nucleotide alpha hydrolase (AANH) superfamily ATPase
MKKLLLHTCCAPCSVTVIEELKDKYNLTVFFYNPNIHPFVEYEKRKQEVIKICQEGKIKMVDGDYEIEKWHQEIQGLEKEPEGGSRCKKCFIMRLEKAIRYAKENNFDIFSTTLTSGRNKLATIIHPLAEILVKKYGVEFLAEDWKKNGRQEIARRLVKEKNIYRQNYCGCKFSQKSTSISLPSA